MRVNERMKKLLSIALTMCMVLAYVPSPAGATGTGNHTHDGSYVAPENPECTCAEKCEEANVWCDVCRVDHTKCLGQDTAGLYSNDFECGEDHLVLDGVDNKDGTHTGICEMCYQEVTVLCQYYSTGYDATHHWDECNYCGAVCQDGGIYGEHELDTEGYCYICEYQCEHTNCTDGVCDNCGVVCDHNFDSTGKCDGCGAQAEAKVGDTVYPTFAEALNYWTEDTTLTLLGDVSYTGIPSLTDNGMKLHLNGYTLTLNGFNSNIPRIEVGIYDPHGVDAGSLDIVGPGRINGTIECRESTVTMENVTVNSNYNALGISGESTVTINDCTLQGGQFGIENSGSVTLNGTNIVTARDIDAYVLGAAIRNYGTVTINGTLTLTGGSRGEIQLYSDASVILNAQPNGIWRMNKEGGGTVAVPGQGITLDVASFASATPGYKVSKAENGSIELVACDHADGEISYEYVSQYSHNKIYSCCNAKNEYLDHDFSNGTCVCGADCLYFYTDPYEIWGGDYVYVILVEGENERYYDMENVDYEYVLWRYVYHSTEQLNVCFENYFEYKTETGPIPEGKNCFRATGLDENGHITGFWYSYPCSHSFKDGVCIFCKIECEHEWNEDFVCKHCSMVHTHEFNKGFCRVCETTCEHKDTLDEYGFCTVCDMREIFVVTDGWSECEIYYEYIMGTPLGEGVFRFMIRENAEEFHFAYFEEYDSYSTVNLTLPEAGYNCYYVGEEISDDGWGAHEYGGKWAWYPCEHSWQDGECAKCGTKCGHSWEDGVCTECGKECDHPFYWDGKCYFCGKECEHTSYQNGKCSLCFRACPEHQLDEYGFCTVCDMRKIYVVPGGWSQCIAVYDDNRVSMETVADDVFWIMLPEEAESVYFYYSMQECGEYTYDLTLPAKEYNCYYVGACESLVDDNYYYGGQWGTYPCTHAFEDGVCTICGADCTHDHYTDGKCDSCGHECPHDSYVAGKCEVCGCECTHVSYENGFCTVCDGYEPATLVTAENSAELDLSADYIGYYAIGNAGQLYWFADKVDTENDTYGSAKVVLAADITVNEGEITASSTGVRVWNPIGDKTNIFNGTFDGNGKTVSGLYYNNSENNYVGLFARVSERGVVKNVTVTKSYFCGYYHVAGIVGLNEGTVTDCVNRAMMDCEGYSGGIVGNNQGNISNCLNYGTIHGSGNQGGIVGCNRGTVEFCGNEGSISTGWMHAGGIVGDNTGTVRNCWNTGDVYAKTNCAGGIAGSNIKYSGNTVPVVENCWSTGSVTPVEKSAVGGIVGRSKDSSQNNCYSVMKPVGQIQDENGVSTVENMEAKTLEQFASGEVAYLLQKDQSTQVWGQNIDNGQTVQTVPVFSDAKVYYGYASCSDTEKKYTNSPATEEKPEHTEQGIYTLTEDKKQHILTYNCCATVIGPEDHTYDFATGKCACGVQVEASATVSGSTVYYNSLEEAMSVVKDAVEEQQAKVRLYQDVQGEFTVPTGTYTLDLNGNTISSKAAYECALIIPENAVVTLTGNGKVLSKYRAVMVEGTLTVENGYFEGAQAALWNNGSLTINGGTFVATGTEPDEYENVFGSGLYVHYMATETVLNTADAQFQGYVEDIDLYMATLTINMAQNDPDWTLTFSNYQPQDKPLIVPGDGVTLDLDWFTYEPVRSYVLTIGDDGCVYVIKCPHTDVGAYEARNKFEHAQRCNTCGSYVNYEEHTTVKKATCVSKAVCELCGEYGEFNPDAHHEVYTVSEDGATCTASCSLCDMPPYTVSIAAPEHQVYGDGKPAYAICLVNGENADEIGHEIYYRWVNDTWVQLDEAPVDAGIYRVECTWGDSDEDDSFTLYVEYEIAKATPTIVWPEDNCRTIYNGTSAEIVPPVVTLVDGEVFDGTITYSYTGDSSGTGLPTDAGTYEITASIAAQDNYTAATTENKLTLTIAKKEITVKADAVSKIYGETDPELTYQVEGLVGGDQMSGELKRVAGENVGTYAIEQNTLTAGNNYAITYTGANFTIRKADPIVTAPAANDRVYDGTVQELLFAGSATGGTMVYSMLEDDTYGSIPVAENAGTYTVWYMVKGDSNHNDTAPQSVTVTIAKAPVTVLGTDMTVTYNGQDIDLRQMFSIDENAGTIDYTIIDLTGDGTFTGAPYLYQIIKAGTFTVKVTTEETENYLSGSATAVLTVNKAAGSGTVTMEGWTYGENANAPVASGTGAVTYRYSTEDGKVPANAGTYTVTAIFGATDLYEEATATAEFTIAKKSIQVTADTKSKTYGDADPALTYTVNGLVGGDQMTGELKRVANENVGTYTIEQNTLTAGDNYTILYTGANFTINPKPITVKADAVSKIYGETDPTLTYTVNGLVGEDQMSGELKRVEGENIGTYAIEQNTLTAGNNYTITYTGAELTINPKPVTADDVKLNGSLVYTGSEQTQPITVTEGITYEVSGNKATEAGTYELTVKGTGNYTGEVKLSWSIKVADSVVETAPAANELTYTGKDQDLVTAGTAIGGKLVYSLSEDGEYTETVPTGKNAGEYTVWYYIVGDANHADSEKVAVKVEIAKAALTITSGNSTITYGDAPTARGVIGSGFVNGESFADLDGRMTLSIDYEQYGDVGIYTITHGGWTSENYEITYVSGTMTVNPKPITVKADAVSKIYGNADPELTYQVEGLVNGDQMSGELKRVEGENVGTYAIEQNTLTAGNNYTITYTGADFTISKRAVAVTAKDQTIVYGTEISATEYTADGLVEGHTATAILTPSTEKVTANGTITAGTAVITADGADVTANYEITYMDGKLVIQPDTSKIDGLTTENVTSANEEDIKAVQDMLENADSIAEEWNTISETCKELMARIEEVRTENDRIEAAVSAYDVETVKSSDEEAITQLISDIDAQLATDNLTDEERATLEELKTKCNELLAKIAEVADLIAQLDKTVDDMDAETVKSTDKETLEQVIEDAQKLIDGGNVTEAEKETLRKIQEEAQALIQVIDDIAAAIKKATEKAESYDEDSVNSADKAELKKLAEDIEALLDTENLTEEERAALEKLLEQVKEMISIIDKTAATIKAAKDLIDARDPETVTSEDKDELERAIDIIEGLLNGNHLTYNERNALADAKAEAEEMLDAIEAAQKATETENTEKVEEVTSENVKPEDKETLEAAKEDLERALEDNGSNYTEEEKQAIQEEIQRIEEAIEALENVETVADGIAQLPETVEPDDEATAEKILASKAAYEALTDHEKSLVDEAVKSKLDQLLASLSAYDIIEGDEGQWTKGCGEGLSFVANGPLSKFVGIVVDEIELDKASFETKSGSTVITLIDAYLESLTVGEHTITVVYTDGETSGTFTVLPKAAPTCNILLWIIVMVCLAVVVIVLVVIKKRRSVK